MPTTMTAPMTRRSFQYRCAISLPRHGTQATKGLPAGVLHDLQDPARNRGGSPQHPLACRDASLLEHGASFSEPWVGSNKGTQSCIAFLKTLSHQEVTKFLDL